MDAPIEDGPSIVIYHPSEPNSNTFANIGFLGLIGSLTSISKNGITGGEKVLMDESEEEFYPIRPTTTYDGKPWMFVLRDTV